MLPAAQRSRECVEAAGALHVSLKAARERREHRREDAHRLRIAEAELLAHLFDGAAVLRRENRFRIFMRGSAERCPGDSGRSCDSAPTHDALATAMQRITNWLQCVAAASALEGDEAGSLRD
jgi:hypothetical protein